MPTNTDVILSCAVTGTGDAAGKHPSLPITPEQIASAEVDVVLDPTTGVGGTCHPHESNPAVAGERARERASLVEHRGRCAATTRPATSPP